MTLPSYLSLPAILNYGPTQVPPTTTDDAPVGAAKLVATQALLNSTATAMQAVFPSGDTTGATDTAAIQAAITLIMADTTGNQRGLQLYGQYWINAKLIATWSSATNLQQGPIMIVGFGNTVINAVGSNFGILEFQTPYGSSCNGLVIRNINFSYQTQQTASNTSSVCIGFRSVAGNDIGSIFQITIANCEFNNFFRGIANVQTSGAYTTWGLLFEQNYFYNGTGSAIYLVPPTGRGQPRITLLNNYINMNSNYSAQIAAEPAIHIDQGECLVVMGTELNLIYQTTGYYFVQCELTMIRNKIETCTYGGNTAYPVFLGQCIGSVDGFDIDDLTLTGNQYAFNIAGLYTNQSMRLAGFFFYLASGAYTFTYVVLGTSPVVFQDVPTQYGSLPSGAVFRLVYSGGSTSSNLAQWAAPPAGMMSADNGDASITPNPLTSAQVQVFNTPLTANRTVTLSAANGSVTADNSLNNTTFTILRTLNSNDSNTLTVIAANPTTVAVPIGGSATFVYNRALGGYVQTQAAETSVLSSSQDVQVFTAGGTWTAVANNYKSVRVIAIGGAGGGGSGALTASATASSGGGGGGGGGYSDVTLPAATVTSPQTVVVGTGGAGGAAVSSAGAGNNGSPGNYSQFSNLVTAFAGGYGAGGAVAAVSSGGGGGSCVANASGATAGSSFAGAGGNGVTGSISGYLGCASGGGGGANGGAGAAAGLALWGGGGGGAGGGVSVAPAAFSGGNGSTNAWNSGTSYAAGGTAGNAGGNSPHLDPWGCGGGAGGGGSSVTGNGGAGGTGFLGAGGGGGGSAIGTNNSGAGGNGGNGLVVVITYF